MAKGGFRGGYGGMGGMNQANMMKQAQKIDVYKRQQLLHMIPMAIMWKAPQSTQ